MRRTIALLLAITTPPTTVVGAAAAPADAVADLDLADAAGHGRLAATIRYTEFGIPHIRAANFAGLGFGYGFAAATDNICDLADIYLTVGAQRSRYLGPDAAANSAYGAARNSLASDLYFRQVIDSGVVERSLADRLGPRPEVRELVRGYVAGYNRFLRDRPVTDPACRGAAWVRPIAEMDVYRQFYALATIAGQGQGSHGVNPAQPPAASAATVEGVPADAADLVREALGSNDLGSNGIAIGSA